MKCIAGRDYEVIREREKGYKWWLEEAPKPHGAIKALECAYCNFSILKRHVQQPRSSKSGLGRYNRMRAIMIAHIHQEHREALRMANEETEAVWAALIKQGWDARLACRQAEEKK